MFGSLCSLRDRRCGCKCHIWPDGAGRGLWRALVGPQENFVLGGPLLAPALLVGQKFLETSGCKGESLPTKAHQVGILKPGVIEAVLNGGTGPRVATEDLFKKQRGTLGHILVQFGEVKLCRLDPDFSLLRIIFHERRPTTQHDESQYAHAPDVSWRPHHIPFQHLWRHVLQCSNRRAELFEEQRVEALSAAKVDDLDDVHVGDNDILWLDVEVENTSSVEVVQPLEDLRDICHHVVLRVTEPVYEAVEQLFPTAVLRDKNQVARCDISFMQSHDPVMMK